MGNDNLGNTGICFPRADSLFTSKSMYWDIRLRSYVVESEQYSALAFPVFIPPSRLYPFRTDIAAVVVDASRPRRGKPTTKPQRENKELQQRLRVIICQNSCIQFIYLGVRLPLRYPRLAGSLNGWRFRPTLSFPSVGGARTPSEGRARLYNT